MAQPVRQYSDDRSIGRGRSPARFRLPVSARAETGLALTARVKTTGDRAVRASAAPTRPSALCAASAIARTDRAGDTSGQDSSQTGYRSAPLRLSTSRQAVAGS